MQEKRLWSSGEWTELKTIDFEYFLVDLANLREDETARIKKAHRWLSRKLTIADLLTRRDELRILWEDQVRGAALGKLMRATTQEQEDEEQEWLDRLPSQITERTRLLYDECEIQRQQGRADALAPHVCRYWLRQGHPNWDVNWASKDRKILAIPRWFSGLLAFLAADFSDRMAFCRNPACSMPFFLTARKEQKYCSPNCSSPSKKAAKLRWWHENRGKQSAKRRTKTRSKKRKEDT